MVVAYQVNAGGTVETLTHTVIDIVVAVLTSPTWLANALIVSYFILARQRIHTWAAGALVCI